MYGDFDKVKRIFVVDKWDRSKVLKVIDVATDDVQKGVKELYIDGVKTEGNIVPMAKVGQTVKVKAVLG